jgi:SAM-dependent methyltransferase
MEMSSPTIHEAFFREYTSQDAIIKYSRRTGGCGISYLLDHGYKDVYMDSLCWLPPNVRERGINVLEFGCGAGMNLLYLILLLNQKGITLARAIGTDFSPVLIETAKQEAKDFLDETQREKVEFNVARNESLFGDLVASIEAKETELADSFQFILGVNTIRYCHAAKKQVENARDIFKLLAPGGVCAVIDMNNRFPLFRSDLRNSLRWNKVEQCYVPSLEEYAGPFAETGFEIIRQEHFCWIAHSAGRLRFGVMKALSPILNVVAKSRAMRSLVVARKPMTGQQDQPRANS